MLKILHDIWYLLANIPFAACILNQGKPFRIAIMTTASGRSLELRILASPRFMIDDISRSKLSSGIVYVNESETNWLSSYVWYSSIPVLSHQTRYLVFSVCVRATDLASGKGMPLR
jgi:hypothetical protein